jgi:hypothetical protein
MPETPNTSPKLNSTPPPAAGPPPVPRHFAAPPFAANRVPRPPVVHPVIHVHTEGSKTPWILVMFLLAVGSACAYYFFYYKNNTPPTGPTILAGGGETSTRPPSDTGNSTGNATENGISPALPPRSDAATPFGVENTMDSESRADAKSIHANRGEENLSKTEKTQTAADSAFVGPLWEGSTSFFFARDGTAWEWSNDSDSAWFGKWEKIDEESILCTISEGHVFKISPDKNQIQRYGANGAKFQPPRSRRLLSPSPDIRDVLWNFKSPGARSSSSSRSVTHDTRTGDTVTRPSSTPGWELVFKSDGIVTQQQVHSGQTYYYDGKWVDLGGGYFGKKMPGTLANNIYKVSEDNKTLEQRFTGGTRIWRRKGPVPAVIKFMPSLNTETHILAGTKWSYGLSAAYALEFLPDGTLRYHAKEKTVSSRWFAADGGTAKVADGTSLFDISMDGQLLSQIKENKVTKWRRADDGRSLPRAPFAMQPESHPLAGTKWKSALNENAMIYFRADGALLIGKDFQKNAGRWNVVNDGTARDGGKTQFYLALNKKNLTEVSGDKATLWHRQTGESALETLQIPVANNGSGVGEESAASLPVKMDSAEDVREAYEWEARKLLTPVCDKYIVRLNKLKSTATANMLNRINEAIESIQQQKTYLWKPVLESKDWTSTERAFSKIKDEYDSERIRTYRVLENKYKPIYTRMLRSPNTKASYEEGRACQLAMTALFPARVYVQMHNWIPSWDKWETWVFQEDERIVIYDTSRGAVRTNRGDHLRWKIVNTGETLYLIYSGGYSSSYYSSGSSLRYKSALCIGTPFYFDLRTNNRDLIKAESKSIRGETASFRSIVHSRSR